ncbi:MAG: hypothetical protein JNL97_03915 [Verrucomicrobiales bacterium]|nr:hypothetical protein [Verrucomicrobiales bacterium]
MMRRSNGKLISGLTGILGVAGALSSLAATQTWDFSSDPTTGPAPLTIGGNGINPGEYQTAGGNPGGFLALTWPVGSQVSIARFPNIDPGKVVTAFKFEADLRVGNSTGDRAADGFSVSFARDGDPALADENVTSGNQGVFAGGIAEGGSTTGIAVSFDTWSGNTLPDGNDIEGIIVRVDNKTVLRQSLPTRHGACDDATSLQTGPRDAAYWTAGGDFQDPVTWAQLCWQKFVIDLTEDAKLSVSWKGKTILDKFQTQYFPTASQLVLAGRTGGANEHTHFDNIKLTTVAASCASAPTAPGNLRSSETGARRVVLAWDPSTVAGDPGARLGYEIERDGTVIASGVVGGSYEVKGLDPSKSYAFRVRSKNVCADPSPWASVSVTTVAEVDSPGFLTADVFRTATDGTPFNGAGNDVIDTVISDAKYPNSPDNRYYVNGFSFGEPAFGDTYGENHMVRIAGVFTAPESGNFRFFIRSDDASRLYVKAGTAIPNPASDSAIAVELGCCGPFEEVGAGDNGDGTFPTSEPVALTAGSKYGILFLVKEGGGGDWGQVAMRKEGDARAASSLPWIRGPVVTGKSDPVGASVEITGQPANATVDAYKSASFTVAAQTASPYAIGPYYQWYKNGAIIPGANAATYNIAVVQPGDNGAKYKCEVGVVGKAAQSAEATLTVNAAVPAKIASVTGSDSFTAITVKFDQPVVAPSATTAGNYTVSGLTVSAAALVDQFTVRLTTSRQTEGAKYTVTARNVANLGGGAAETSGEVTAWSLVAGRARAEQYTGFNGAGDGEIDTVLADAKWTGNNPDVLRYVNGLSFGEPNFGDTWGENHMVAIKAVLKPAETGSYTFHVRSDDASRLYINTGGADIPNPTTATVIARETGCCTGYLEAPEESVSEPVSLTAGQSYGVLFLVKEGGGGDWGQVGWRKAGTSTPVATIVNQAYWYGPPAPAANPTIAIARGAAGAQITYTGSLQSATDVKGPYTDVAGASSPYTVPAGANRFFRSRN